MRAKICFFFVLQKFKYFTKRLLVSCQKRKEVRPFNQNKKCAIFTLAFICVYKIFAMQNKNIFLV